MKSDVVQVTVSGTGSVQKRGDQEGLILFTEQGMCCFNLTKVSSN